MLLFRNEYLKWHQILNIDELIAFASAFMVKANDRIHSVKEKLFAGLWCELQQ